MVDTLLSDIAALQGARAGRAPAFDPVSLLVHRELDLSRVFAWMLDPRETHKDAAAHLEAYLKLTGDPGMALERTRVQLEATVRKAGVAGRVDILLRHPGWTIAIENKPWANFRNGQIDGYVGAMAAKREVGLVIVMLGKGWHEGFVEKLNARPNVVCLMLGLEIRDWVFACASSAQLPAVRDFLNDFGRYLNTRFGDGWDDDMQTDVDAMLKSPESIAATVRIYEAQDAFLAGMSRRFKEIITNRCLAVGLKPRPVAGELMLFTTQRSGCFRIDIGQPNYDFAVEADMPMLEQLGFGLCMREAARSLGGKYGVLIAELSQLFERREDPSVWWPWSAMIEELNPSQLQSKDKAALWNWAIDDGDDGLPAILVQRALEMKAAIEGMDAVGRMEEADVG